MKTQPHPSDRQVLAGLVERVTYQNAENGFCVIRVKARSHRDLVTVVGHAATIAAGEWITASGDWVNDRTHGQQFRARFLKTSEPTTVEGIEKYLASGMIRGIGPTYAKKLLRAFGEKVFEVIESQADRLREVGGIGPVRAARIVAAWAEQKAVREIMVFLHSHGVGTARAVRPSLRKVFMTKAVCGSDVRALVKQPFAVFSRRKLLIAVVTCRDYARRGLAANDDIFDVTARAAEALTCRGPVRPPLKNA